MLGKGAFFHFLVLFDRHAYHQGVSIGLFGFAAFGADAVIAVRDCIDEIQIRSEVLGGDHGGVMGTGGIVDRGSRGLGLSIADFSKVKDTRYGRGRRGGGGCRAGERRWAGFVQTALFSARPAAFFRLLAT